MPLFHDQIRQGGPVTITDERMTRFLMTLDEAVDCVFAALQRARRGETFIPQAPSSTVIDLAKALIGERKIDISISGIRPGEKIHEILISDEESRRAEQRDGYYAIRPALPELAETCASTPTPLQGEFSSRDHVIGVQQTWQLLMRHRLLVDATPPSDGIELFERAAA